MKRIAVGKRAAAAVPAGLAALFAIASLWPRSKSAGEFEVRRKRLDISVPFAGILSPETSDTYGAGVAGVETKILWLAEEGSLVKPGDRLIQFDATPFEKGFADARSRSLELGQEADQARAALLAARAVRESEVREAMDAAESSHRDLESLVNTEAPLEAQKSAQDLERKQREAQEAKDRYERLAPFAEQGFISQEELRAAKDRLIQADADLRLAEAEHSALVHEKAPNLVQQKSEDSETRRQQVGFVQEKSKAQVVQSEAFLRLSELRRDSAKRQVEEYSREIAGCVVSARSSGLVIYGELFDKNGERRKVRIGDSVWASTPVVILPDLSRFLIHGQVSESDVHRLRLGQSVEIRLDAFPMMSMTGTLKHIGSLETSTKGDSRAFSITVSLAKGDPRFRPGMLARGTIRCGVVPNSLVVPIDAVRTDAHGSYCLVRSAIGEAARRDVTLGESNAQYVAVLRGLRGGETVLLGEP